MPALLIAFILAFGVTEASAQGGAVATPAKTPPAQQPSAAPAQAPAPAAQAAAVSTDYQVGPQDVLNITVFGEPGLSGKVRIDNDGSFQFQYLGRVKADNLTVAQIEAVIKKGLADGYIRNPQVSVEVDSYHSQNVFVQGEVRAPNKYSLPGNSTLMEVLALAGSVTPTAGHWVYINHTKQGVTAAGPNAIVMDDPTVADIKVNLRDIQSGKAQNIRVQDGDTVFVPKQQVIYVSGQVRTPGQYPYDDDMTVYTAIATAGGVSDKGSQSRISVRRLINGQLKEIDVKQEDSLKPGDQVIVKARLL
jgi:polysaccharide export outer membrane protein